MSGPWRQQSGGRVARCCRGGRGHWGVKGFRGGVECGGGGGVGRADCQNFKAPQNPRIQVMSGIGQVISYLIHLGTATLRAAYPFCNSRRALEICFPDMPLTCRSAVHLFSGAFHIILNSSRWKLSQMSPLLTQSWEGFGFSRV